MTNYREILRLKSLGFSQRNIALSCPCSRNTVSKILKKAKELNIAWPLSEEQTNSVLENLFKRKDGKSTRSYSQKYFHKKAKIKS